MFSYKKKLDPNLKDYMKFNLYRSYRVLIKHTNFSDFLMKKITSYKGKIIRKITNCNLICAKLNNKAIERLLEYPEVDYIFLDTYLHLCGNNVKSSNKFNLSINSSITGTNIGIGIVDSGVYPHKDLTVPYNRISFFEDLVNGISYPYDDNGHGTCISGILSGNGESSNGVYKGIASSSSLYCFKAFDALGKGFVSDVLYSIDKLINMAVDYNIKVLCLPFELLNYNKFIFEEFDSLFKIATTKNIIPVVPSGSINNIIDGSMTGIALSKNCLTVSGLNSNSSIKPFLYSSAACNKKDYKPDFAAACVDIVSLNCNVSYISEKNNIRIPAPKLNTSYTTFTGTSLSAAYIAGVCALLFDFNPELSFDDVVSMLKASCKFLDLPSNIQGEGIINIKKIIKVR